MTLYPPLLLKYLKMYQDDPSSRIFAPLSECYRKIGMADEAIEICKEGIAANPDFTGGKVALARAYFDKKMYAEARELLLPVIDRIPDNIVAQKLLADASLFLGYFKDALNAYKMLLYFNPADHDVARTVQELETQSYEQGGVIKGGGRPEKLRKLVKLQKLLTRVQRAQGFIVG
ncbi:MAG: tetratricopeptide repeat protein [Deltaproteobacteria bacterium]|nr:tetratricopeptide repeat protein [Deltaproteobacteria bacterium]